jgi:hypothetical protein
MNRLKNYTLILLIFLSSCKDTSSEKVTKQSTRKIDMIKEDNHIVDERHYVRWEPRYDKDTKSIVIFTFHKESAVFWYDAKCPFSFKTKKTSRNTFDLFWSTQNECKDSNFKILNQSDGALNFPKDGDYFAKYTTLTDSIISVEYKFLDWTKKVNELAKDSLFPKYIYFVE